MKISEMAAVKKMFQEYVHAMSDGDLAQCAKGQIKIVWSHVHQGFYFWPRHEEELKTPHDRVVFDSNGMGYFNFDAVQIKSLLLFVGNQTLSKAV